MVTLIKKLEGEVLTNKVGSVGLNSNIIGVIQNSDYINVYGLDAYIQNYTKTNTPIESLEKPSLYGLPNNYNLETQTLNIDY